MKRLLAVLALAGLTGAAPDAAQVGLYGGVGPSEPLHTQYLAGGWVGVGLGEHLRVELSGSFQGGLSQRSDLYEFLLTESLIDPDDALADEVVWTAEALLRLEPLRGRLALLQAAAGGYALHIGAGGGVRALESPHGAGHLAPTGLLAVGADLVLVEWLRVRADVRGYGMVRRDDTFGMGAELLLGVGAGF